MIPAGYMLKNVVRRPEWIVNESVVDILSLSGCVSTNFADYIKFWKHNGYWLFDSPEILRELVEEQQIDASGMDLFYYEVYEEEFSEETALWSGFSPEPSFPTSVGETCDKKLEGYDVVTFYAHTSPECSPLSCNSLASTIAVNEHCLLNTFDDARRALVTGQFNDSEPGPFRIFAVYKLLHCLPRTEGTNLSSIRHLSRVFAKN